MSTDTLTFTVSWVGTAVRHGVKTTIYLFPTSDVIFGLWTVSPTLSSKDRSLSVLMSYGILFPSTNQKVSLHDRPVPRDDATGRVGGDPCR